MDKRDVGGQRFPAAPWPAPRDQPDGLTRAAGTRREAQSSGLVGRIEIERVGLSAIVVEGTTATALRRGVGHVSGTAYPGEAGNVALAGHRDSFFRLLSQVESGDRITLTTPDGCFAYLVDSVLVVGPRRGDLLRGNHEPRLTLVTCYPFYYVGPAPRRFVVVAHALEEAGKAARTESPSTPGGPTYVASAIR